MTGAVYLTAFSYANDFKRFFFLSECTWLALFAVLLGANTVLNNPILYVNCFFILVFTACEAVIFAAILLLGSESSSHDSYKKSQI